MDNILILTSGISIDIMGGSYRFALKVSEALKKLGYNVYIITPKLIKDTKNYEEYNGIKIFRYRYKKNTFFHVDFKDILKELPQKYSMVWGHGPIQTYLYLKNVKKINNLLYTVHSPLIKEYCNNDSNISFFKKIAFKKIQKYNVKKSFVIHTLSDYMFKVAKYEIGEDLENKYHITQPGGIDIKQYYDINLLDNKTRLLVKNNIPYFFVLRRIENRMGFKNLVKAIEILNTKKINYHVVIGGKGSLLDNFKRECKDKNIKNIHFLGFIKDESIASYYKYSKCSIIPTQYLEGFGLSLIESFINYTPAIVTPVGGMYENLINGFSELITLDRTAESIAERMEYMLGIKDDLYNNLCLKCFNKAQEYEWTRITSLIIKKFNFFCELNEEV